MNKRQKPYFDSTALSAILDNFRASMDEASRYYDANLLEAVERYVQSPKHEYENAILRHVADGRYRFFYEKGSSTYGIKAHPNIAAYKAKYPQSVEELRQDGELWKQALLDSVELDLKKHLEALREDKQRLGHAINMVGMSPKEGVTGRIDIFLTQPFEERSTAEEAVPVTAEATPE